MFQDNNDPALVESVLDGVYKGLYETKEWKGKEFTVFIDTEFDDATSAKKLIIKITRFTHWFERSQIENWMFLGNISRFKNEDFDKN